MSRLYFETEDETAELKGWEYHWIRGLASDVSAGFLRLQYDHLDWLPLINPRHYMSKYDEHADRHQWAEMFKVALNADGSGGETLLSYKGHKIDAWHLMLNTGIMMGGDAVRLATRLGAQGEIHAWVDGPDRAWVADMIEHAVKSGVYRTGLPRPVVPGLDRVRGTDDPERFTLEPAGWSEVAALLRSSDTGEVVTHYSVGDGFPDRHLAEVDEDVWEDLPQGEHWRMSMESLKVGAWSRRFSGLQIKPADWTTFRYGHTLTVLDLTAPDREKRIQRIIDKGWI